MNSNDPQVRPEFRQASNAELGVVMDAICTGVNRVDRFRPDWAAISLCGSPLERLKVLDFGCGIGRNTFGMAEYSSRWRVTGFDCPEMIGRVQEYRIAKYGDPYRFNEVKFLTMFPEQATFNCVLCSLVFQHIAPGPLAEYVKIIRHVSSCMVVTGRRANDGSGGSTWRLMEEFGLRPVCAYVYGTTEPRPYVAEGDPAEHMTCCYDFSP